MVFKFAVRSDRLCILVAGLLDAFVTAYNLQRTNRGSGPNFKELMYGRIKTDDRFVSGVGAHLPDDVLGGVFHPEQIRFAFRLAKPKRNLPCCLLAVLLPE